MAIYVPIVMYGLRLDLYCSCRMPGESNDMAECDSCIYCCFTRTTLFTKFFTCLYDQS